MTIYERIDYDDSMEDEHKAVINLIKNLRNQNELTQSDLAKMTGFSIMLINRLENGQVDPKLSTLIRICKVLGFSLSEFFDQLKNPNEKKYKKMSNGDKVLEIMNKMYSIGLLPAHWSKIEEEFISIYGFKPLDFNQILVDLSHEKYCKNYPSIGKPVFIRVGRGIYDLLL